ncbi:MAG: response regulator transcription factor [Eubacteriales bacterium]
MTVYIVEDDDNIREMECYALKNSGYEVAGFENGSGLLEACEKILPSIILLDIMLPDRDGLSILKSLRSSERTKRLPVILVTAKGSELDKVKGLDMGADDYISKPFSIMELISRVKALLRRAESEPQQVLECAGIRIDDARHNVTAGGEECALTFKEYELLKLLMSNRGVVMGREKIMDRIWGFDYEGESRTVDMHIKTLRQKLGTCGSAIKTVRGVGYKIEDE